jgi:predicted AAA+ superfamily ATPase
MLRNIDNHLKNWKLHENRNVLLLRGARQVGKTYSARVLGKTFKHFVEVNFEERPAAKLFFDGDLSVAPICEKLSGFFGAPIVPGETLLFFDEVQSCVNCLKALRFFKEQLPSLHVIAAGSLLEFALSEIPSYGVGRITSIFLHPLTFAEFIRAIGGEFLADIYGKMKYDTPIDEPFHNRFLDFFRTYLLIGGLPEVVSTYIQKRDLHEVQSIIASLIATYKDDFSKYKKAAPVARLADTFGSIAAQAGGKFVYSSVSAQISHQEARRCLELLEQSGLVHRIRHTAARGIPLGAQADARKFKAQIFDCGVHQRLLGLDMPQHLVSDLFALVNRGSLAEVFVGLELAGNASPFQQADLYYWHREARASNAEVDFVVQKDDSVIPLEVKSGAKGGMKSIYLFIEERNLPFGIRLSQENFGRYGKIVTMPIYAAGRIPDPEFELPHRDS